MHEIANGELTPADVPRSDADWSAIGKFALTFNGYEACGTFEMCAEIANAGRHGSLTNLRTCLFFEQRRWRHFGEDPDEETMKYIRDVVEQIRDRVSAGNVEQKVDHPQNLPHVPSDEHSRARHFDHVARNSDMEMRDYPIPTQAEQDDFLLRLYFVAAAPLRACVNRAYLDFCRTLRGIGKLPDAAALHTKTSKHLCSWLDQLSDLSTDPNGDTFDARHRDVSEQLCTLYGGYGFDSFTIGQAQKWLNMALKYVYVFGEVRIPGYASLYRLGHVPLDNIMLDRLAQFGAPSLPRPWSRLCDYDMYIDYQRWIRDRFPDSAPLAVEFHLFQASSG